MTLSPLHNYMAELHLKYAELKKGELADYIPELTKANPDWFGIVLVTTDGNVYSIGDADIPFTIQSISKPFTYSLALEDRGLEYLRTKINVEPSGEAFNRISLEYKTGRPRNAMINAGAIATLSQIKGNDGDSILTRILEKYNLLAGRELEIDHAVYQSEKSTGHRNRAIAHLLLNSGILENNPEDILDAYFKQCSVLVTCKDLATMAATLANHGKNPITGAQVIDRLFVPKILSVMSSCGMYDASGTWIHDIGMPAKSGVGGGIIAVLPGKFAIAVFSPPLDEFGNSVRGIEVCKSFSEELGLHMFNSECLSSYTVIRSHYTIDQVPSKRIRSRKANTILAEQGKKVGVYELTGELNFSTVEVFLSQMEKLIQSHEKIVLSLSRVTSIDHAATQLLAKITHTFSKENKQLILTNANNHPEFLSALDNLLSSLDPALSLPIFDSIDLATEWCENHYLSNFGIHGELIKTSYLSQQDILKNLTSSDIKFLTVLGKEIHYGKGDYLCRSGDQGSNLYFILSGYVSIVVSHDCGKSQRIATFDAGSVIGEFSVVDKRPRSADIIATTAVTCLVVDFEIIENDQSEQARRIRMTIIENLARRMVDLIRKANTEIRALSS